MRRLLEVIYGDGPHQQRLRRELGRSRGRAGGPGRRGQAPGWRRREHSGTDLEREQRSATPPTARGARCSAGLEIDPDDRSRTWLGCQGRGYAYGEVVLARKVAADSKHWRRTSWARVEGLGETDRARGSMRPARPPAAANPDRTRCTRGWGSSTSRGDDRSSEQLAAAARGRSILEVQWQRWARAGCSAGWAAVKLS
jgi:hypothetical protein